MKYQQVKITLYSLVITIIFIQLLGCGGGGSDAVTLNPPPPIVTDTTPPTVTLIAPLDYAIDVQQDTLIKVSFNELINGSTLNNSSFVVKDAMDNIVPGLITESNTTYTFTPDSTLKFDTSYNVTITTSVTDLADNNLENTYSWVFYTVKVPGPTTPASFDVSNLTDNSVTLNGLFTNPSNYTTTAWFEYGLTDSYGSTTPSAVYAAVATINHSADLISLPDKTIYHYRIVTQNSDGVFYGDDNTFRTYISSVTLADTLDAPTYMHLYNNELYWNEVYGKAIKKISIGGGTVVTEASTSMSPSEVHSFEMDLTHIYFGAQQNIWIKPIGTGASTLITSLAPLGCCYFTYLDYLYILTSGGINKIAIADGSVSSIISGQPSYISGMVVDASGIYWSHYINGTINKSAHDGSSTAILAVNLNNPHSLILDAGRLYWAESNAIKSMSTTGGQITTIANNVSPSEISGNMAKDSTHIYFTELDEIKSVEINTGEINILTIGQKSQHHPHAEHLVADDTHIYWLIGGNHYYPPLGQVRKCVKSY